MKYVKIRYVVVISLFIFLTSFIHTSKAVTPTTIPTPKTCGEYLDRYGAMESLLPDLINPSNDKNKNLGQFPEINLVTTNGDTYFHSDQIQAIWGKDITGTSYIDKDIDEKVKAALQRIQDQSKKLQESLPPELRSKATPTPSSPTIDQHIGEVNWANCTVFFSPLTVTDINSRDWINVSYAEFINQAPQYTKDSLSQEFKKSPETTLNNIEVSTKIGDSYYYLDASIVLKTLNNHYFVVYATKGKFAGSVMFYDQAKRSKAEDILRLILNDKGSDASPTPPANESDNEAPIIDSISSSAVMSAGIKKSFNNQTGVVTFIDNALILTITGGHLTGATLATNNVGVDRKPGIEFRSIKVSSDGKTVQAQMIVKQTALDGGTILTLTNSAGKSAQTKFDVLITGTQYLQRKFSDSNVKFFGDWPQFMPDKEILDFETEVRTGLNAINKNSYQKLGIMVQIYAEDFWDSTAESKYCGAVSTRGFSAGGCATESSRIIYVLDERGRVPSTILHESAHKLHFYYQGSYMPVRIAPTTLEKEWLSALGTLNNCNYLPLEITNWSDGTNLVPHCGFIRSYGALGVDKGTFYEDIATFAVARVFETGLLQKIDPNDKRYDQKINILNKYDF